MDATVTRVIDMWAKPLLPRRNEPLPRATANPSRDSGSQHSRSKESVPPTAPQDNSDSSALSPGLLHKILVQGYLKPGHGERQVPPLQIRRTLDHYFYSHLESTSRRDGDQVIQRYTSRFMNVKSKMFMVDQLWIWILDDSKRMLIISHDKPSLIPN